MSQSIYLFLANLLSSFYLFIYLFFISSGPQLPDGGEDDAAQQSQVHGERRQRLRPQASSDVQRCGIKQTNMFTQIQANYWQFIVTASGILHC